MKSATRRSLVIFGATSVSAFWVNAAGHAWMLWRGNPLVRDYKATLTYRSALLGDSTLLPLVNVLLDRQLDAWGGGPRGGPRGGRSGRIRRRRLVRSVLAGIGMTLAIHIYQAAQGLTNWTMPRPWRWNTLGYYHALYMASNATLVAYFCAAAAARARANGLRVLFTRRLAAALVCFAAWAALLYKDYY